MKKKIQEDSSPIPVVSTEPLECTKQDDCVTEVLDVFTACAVTRATSRGKSRQGSDRISELKCVIPQLPKLPASLDRNDFILAQKEDEGLGELVGGALSGDEMPSSERGYFILEGLLVRKFVSYCEGLTETLLQIVVPNWKGCLAPPRSQMTVTAATVA